VSAISDTGTSGTSDKEKALTFSFATESEPDTIQVHEDIYGVHKDYIRIPAVISSNLPSC